MPTVSGNPEHCLARAKEARAMAAKIKDAAAARGMLDIAESYEKIAKRAEARELGIGPQSPVAPTCSSRQPAPFAASCR